jgi:hypothetical protein
MSGVNGDKSRFHRVRKQKIARRLRNEKLFAGQVAPKSASVPASQKPASQNQNKDAKVSA